MCGAYGAAMRYALRVVVPDRPGALGELASALGAAQVDVVSLDVVERADGVAVDDMQVDASMPSAQLRAVFEGCAGIVVEALHPVAAEGSHITATSLAADLAEQPGAALSLLVQGWPAALGVTWAVAASFGAMGLEIIVASDGAPEVPAGLRVPGLPATGARRFPPAGWMPAGWRSNTAGLPEVAAVRLGGPYGIVLAGRAGGPRFREPELRRLAELTRIAVAVGGPVIRPQLVS